MLIHLVSLCSESCFTVTVFLIILSLTPQSGVAMALHRLSEAYLVPRHAAAWGCCPANPVGPATPHTPRTLGRQGRWLAFFVLLCFYFAQGPIGLGQRLTVGL